MEKQKDQEFAHLEVKRLCGVFGAPLPLWRKSPWIRSGAAPPLSESGTGGAVTKKRRRPVHLHVMVSEEEQALIRGAHGRGWHPQHGGLYAENGP